MNLYHELSSGTLEGLSGRRGAEEVPPGFPSLLPLLSHRAQCELQHVSDTVLSIKTPSTSFEIIT